MSEVRYPFGELLEAIFIQRDNRFRAEVELNGQRVKVYSDLQIYEELLGKKSIYAIFAVLSEGKHTWMDLIACNHIKKLLKTLRSSPRAALT